MKLKTKTSTQDSKKISKEWQEVLMCRNLQQINATVTTNPTIMQFIIKKLVLEN